AASLTQSSLRKVRSPERLFTTYQETLYGRSSMSSYKIFKSTDKEYPDRYLYFDDGGDDRIGKKPWLGIGESANSVRKVAVFTNEHAMAKTMDYILDMMRAKEQE